MEISKADLLVLLDNLPRWDAYVEEWWCPLCEEWTDAYNKKARHYTRPHEMNHNPDCLVLKLRKLLEEE